jgi:hypothetical protein
MILLGSVLWFVAVRVRRPRQRETVDQRIIRLTSALSKAARMIQEVEAEIREHGELVDKLRRDAETYEKLKDLHREEVEAVAQTLKGELVEQGRRSRWGDVLMGTAFLFLG